MAVLLNTSLGDIVIDLHTELCPLTTKNFLKLCKIKYYNNCLFHSVQKDFIVQTGDPTGSGSGGESIYKFLYGDQARFFDDEIHPKLKHDKLGTVAMASAGENLNASQFYITTRAGLDYLDGKHTVFGELAEGSDTLMRINEAYVDEKGRPYKNIRIKHTYVLDDPFDDPIQLSELIPDGSPELKPPAEGEEVRLEDDWVPMDEQQEPEELEKSLRRKEAHSRAVVLEMVGDIPEAEIKPPENVLFICKLNPVTQEEDLEIIFSRFGKIISADIIRDFKTGDSLCYGFIEFETNEACEAAYFKMDNVLIDDRRIHVDFSQSVARLWTRYRRYGNKDTGGGEGANFAPQAKGGGCFNCGEVGHFAKDCPNDHLKETLGVQEKPKYKLKDIGGQHGDTNKKYEMLFDEGSIDSAGKHVVVQKKEEVARKQKVERSSRREDNLDDNRRILPLKRSPENNLEGNRQRSTRRYGEEDKNNFADGRNNKYGWSRGGKDDGLERNRDRHREKHYSEEKWTEQYRGRHREEREGHSPQKGHRHDGRQDEKVRRQGRDGRQGIEDYSRDSKSGMSHDRHRGFEQEERINQAVRDDRYEIDRKYNKYREDEREARGELRKIDNNHSYKDYNEEKMDKKHEKHRAGKREEKQ